MAKNLTKDTKGFQNMMVMIQAMKLLYLFTSCQSYIYWKKYTKTITVRRVDDSMIIIKV